MSDPTDLYDSVPAGHFIFEARGIVRDANPVAAVMIGIARDELIGKRFEEFLSEADRHTFRTMLERVMAGRGPDSCDITLPGAHGSGRFVRMQAGEHPSDQACCQAVAIDITDRRKAEEELRMIASVYHEIDEAILISGPDHRILTVNPAFTRVTGYSPQEAIGQSTNLLQASHQDREVHQRAAHALTAANHWQGEVRNQRKDGEEYVAWMSIHAVRGEEGEILRRIVVIRDITRQKEVEEAIWNRANYDFVTGLPNRHLFQDRLRQGIRKARRNGQALALLFIDLDQFKEVNDTFGHQVGDALLLEAAIRIRSCVRSTDTTARLGGDEFTVIMSELEDTSRVEIAVRDILQRLSETFRVGGTEIRLSASIGVGVFPSDAREPGELLNHADRAMYAAKASGGGRFRYPADATP